MRAVLLRIAIRLALCVGVLAVLWPTWGPFAILLPFAPLVAIALARPIMDLMEETSLAGKRLALAGLQGRHWSHRGNRIDIAHDIENARWLLASDVRKVIAALPRDEVLQRQYEGRAGTVEDCAGFRIRADAMADYLRKSTDPASLRFRQWLDREVLGGSRNPRARAPQSNVNV